MSATAAAGFVLIAVGMMLLVLVLLSRDHIQRMDEISLGYNVSADNLFFRFFRATDYAFASTFDFCARRTQPNVDFEQVPTKLKTRFRAICALLLVCLACLVVIAVEDYL